MNTTNAHMDLDTVIQALYNRFGDSIVSTQDSQDYIRSLGQQDAGKYYTDLRARFRAGHGKLCFASVASSSFTGSTSAFLPEVEEETDVEIRKRLDARFRALDVMARATAKGVNRAMIVSGPAGLGKSFGVEKAAEEIAGDFEHIKGYIRPTGLFKTLYRNRNKGSLIVFDDIDSLFGDETSLNILKSACDSSDVRKISWLSNTVMEDEDGEEIPSSFIFEGSIIFITNLDFQQQIDKGAKMAPHFEAMVSRSHYLSLGIKNKRDYIVRIKQVLDAGMLNDVLCVSDKEEIVSFIEENMNAMRELSLRMVKKLADLMLMDRDGWKDLARITCMKNS